uniref:Uncharacterized protein n=1 Tax=Lepeophtheirus salmonis TaxID=72036 RepID=A0A0K2T834_LEPSM
MCAHKRPSVTLRICCGVIILCPYWTQSRIGDQRRSNSCQCPCLFPSPPTSLSQLIVADLLQTFP